MKEEHLQRRHEQLSACLVATVTSPETGCFTDSSSPSKILLLVTLKVIAGFVHGTQYTLNEKGYQLNLLLNNVSKNEEKARVPGPTGSSCFISFN